MACLKSCLKSEFVDKYQEESLIDIEKVIRKCAREQLQFVKPAQLTWRERLSSLDKVVFLDVDRSFLGIECSKELTLHGKTRQEPSVLDIPVTMGSGATILFQSRFHNDTDIAQVYSFKTERQTMSSMELSLNHGFTFGKSLDLEIKLPTGLPGCEVSGKLASQLQWSFERGKINRKEDTIIWSVDSQISVTPNKTGEAQLKVSECRWLSDFVVPCKIFPRTEKKKFPVFVRRRKTNDLLQVIYVPCYDVCKESNDFFTLADGSTTEMVCELRGACQVVCALEQEIRLKQATLVQASSNG